MYLSVAGDLRETVVQSRESLEEDTNPTEVLAEETS